MGPLVQAGLVNCVALVRAEVLRVGSPVRSGSDAERAVRGVERPRRRFGCSFERSSTA